MKRSLLLFTTLFFSAFLFAQNCDIPQELRDNYERDVQFMAADFMARSPEYNDIIEIPEYLTREIFSGLASIYNSDICEKHLVFDKYCIHHKNNTNEVKLTVVISCDTSCSWYENWAKGDITTNNPTIDSVLQICGFNKVYRIQGRYNFGLVSSKIVNASAVTNALYKIFPNNYIHSTYYSKTSNSIFNFRRKNGLRHYSFGIYNAWPRGWFQEFIVNPSCIVELKKSNNINPPISKYVKNCNISDQYIPLNITGNIFFNKGESTTIAASKGKSYLWSTGETTPSINISKEDYYSVTVTDENGCTDIAADYVLEQFQDITQEGNRWNIAFHGRNNSGSYTTTSAVKVMGDSIVNGVPYKKLYRAEDALNPKWIFTTLFRQDSLGKVTYSHRPKGYLYDFRLNPGEHVFYQRYNSEAKVKSVDQITDLNGNQRKKIQIDVSESDYSFSETWIEGIGNIQDPLESINVNNNSALLCFYQNGELIYQPNPDEPCYINTLTDSKDVKYTNNIKISPNPTSNTFQILGIADKKIDQLELYSMDGRFVKQYYKTDNIDISNLSSGIYIVKIIVDGKAISKKLVVE